MHMPNDVVETMRVTLVAGASAVAQADNARASARAGKGLVIVIGVIFVRLG